MTSETKRPTARDIELARGFLTVGFHVERGPMTPALMRSAADHLERLHGVLDFALAKLPPDEREIPMPWDDALAREETGRMPEVEETGVCGRAMWVGRDHTLYTCGLSAGHGGPCGAEETAANIRKRESGEWLEVEAPEGADEYLCAAGCGEVLGTPFVPGDICWSCDAAKQSAPEDAGDDDWIAWEGGECPVGHTTVVQIDQRNGIQRTDEAGYFFWAHRSGQADIVRYRLAQPSQPPTDPKARVRAMSGEEVEEALTGREVGPWSLTCATYGRHDRAWTGGPWAAIDINGACYANDSSRRMLSGPQGTTTTPEGRAECNRRLLVHLLRAEGA